MKTKFIVVMILACLISTAAIAGNGNNIHNNIHNKGGNSNNSTSSTTTNSTTNDNTNNNTTSNSNTNVGVNSNTNTTNNQNTTSSDSQNNNSGNSTNTVTSSVNESGNSTNALSSSLNNSNSGNSSSNNAVNISNKVAAASATAPALASGGNDTCMGSSSGGVQALTFGVSGGSTWTDNDCVRRKDAVMLQNMGKPTVALAIMCQSSDVKAAIMAVGSPDEKAVCGKVQSHSTEKSEHDKQTEETHRLFNR